METFIKEKPLVENHDFHHQRRQSLDLLNFDSIDKPIAGIIRTISKIDFCFTLQSCYGHFIHKNQNDPHSTSPLPASPIFEEIEYRIAYIAICLENNQKGKEILNRLKSVRDVDEINIQFGCAEWFWQRQVNSYVLQVEPDRLRCRDKIFIDYSEAKHIEKVRNEFFAQLKTIISNF